MVLAVTANAADRKIDWIAWAFDHEATDLTDDSGATGILANYDVLWQLIHTENAEPALPDLTAENYLGAGESLIDSRHLTDSNPGSWDINLLPIEDYAFSPFSPDASADSYYVYQRIYELPRGATAPSEGDYYYNSALFDLVTEPEWNSDLPFAVFAMGNDEQTMGVKPTLQVPQTQSIPEPATMSLLGLGALVLGLRRKLRK